MRSLKNLVSLAMIGLAILFGGVCNKALAQAKFATPEDAAAALYQALKAENREKMQAIFGREWMEAAASGDPVSDQHDREVGALAMEQSWSWAPHGENTKELIIGDEQWQFHLSKSATSGSSIPKQARKRCWQGESGATSSAL